MRETVGDLAGLAQLAYDSMTLSEKVLPIVLAVLLALAGAGMAGRDPARFARLSWLGVSAAAALLVPGVILTGWFVFFDPDSIRGITTTPTQQTSWILSMSLLGAAVSLGTGVAAYALGGWLQVRLRKHGNGQ